MNRTKWIIGALVVAVAFGAVVALSGGTPEPGAVGSGALRTLQDDGARIVDVRTAGEFAGARIAGAENVPLAEIGAVAAGWDRAEAVVVYCAVGDRSAQAADILRSLGFERVYDLTGGIQAWNGELESGTAVATSVGPSASGLPVLYEFYTDW